MEYINYNASDFDALLNDLITDDESISQSTSISTLDSHSENDYKPQVLVNKKKRKLSSSKNRKVDIVAKDGVLIEFEAYFPKPRIVQTDIRRSYANMFINISNSGDFNLIYGFFDTFTHPSFTHTTLSNFKLQNEKQTLSATVTGSANFAKFWYFGLNKMPDITMTLEDTAILTRDSIYSSSKIVSTCVFKATKIYKDPPSIQLPKGLVYVDDVVTSSDGSNKDKHTLYSEVNESVEDYHSKQELRDVPDSIHAIGVFTFFIDRNNRITRIDVTSNAAED